MLLKAWHPHSVIAQRSDESVWLERISLYERKMIEAQDSQRMMKQELLEANKALKKAVETNTDTIQKYTCITNRSLVS